MKSPSAGVLIVALLGTFLSTAAVVQARNTAHRGTTIDASPVVVHPAPAIEYRHHGLKRVYRGCEPPMEVLLPVENPCCCGCIVEVPVCLPVCCTDVPEIRSHCGLLGRGVVTYRYCCGLVIKVVFDRCGDITVHYYGRF